MQNQAQTVHPIVFNSNLTYGQVSDVDGNTYKTIVIGTPTWMAENLKTTKYNDSTGIPLVTNNSVWANDTTPVYCNYNNTTNPDTINTYGRLYNWYTVNTGNLCPTGWHVPNEGDWDTLILKLDSSALLWDPDSSIAGGKLKETGTNHWNSPNTGANNNSKFTALPAGERNWNGVFYCIGGYAIFWSATDYVIDAADSHVLNYNNTQVIYGNGAKSNGYSVRCLKN